MNRIEEFIYENCPNKHEQTIKLYKAEIVSIQKELGELKDVTHEMLDDYFKIMEHTREKQTVDQRKLILRVYYDWLVKKGIIDSNPLSMRDV